MFAVALYPLGPSVAVLYFWGVESIRRTPSSSMSHHPKDESYRDPTEMHLNALSIVRDKSVYIASRLDSPRE